MNIFKHNFLAHNISSDRSPYTAVTTVLILLTDLFIQSNVAANIWNLSMTKCHIKTQCHPILYKYMRMFSNSMSCTFVYIYFCTLCCPRNDIHQLKRFKYTDNLLYKQNNS